MSKHAEADMHMPTPSLVALHPLRSAGPRPLGPADRRAYDPVYGAWINAARADDLDPAGDDPLRDADDSLARRGLVLRPWDQGDLAAFRAALDNPAVWAHLPEPYPAPLDAGAAATLITLANTLEGHLVRAVVCDGMPLGQVRLDFAAHQPAKRSEAEVSYWLAQSVWGQGMGRVLVAGTVRRAFARMPHLLRVVAKVHPDNTASARVLARAGFRPCQPPPAAVAGGFADWNWVALRRQASRG